jgi:GNAT superfamily N-acetyltransferase
MGNRLASLLAGPDCSGATGDNRVVCAAAITLELARPQDAPMIAQMSRDLVEVGLGWKYQAPTVLRALANAETLTLVARDRDGVAGLAGFAMAHFGDERAHLVLLAVQPSHQRLGIGRQLLQWLLASASTAGIADIELELRAGNLAALQFYNALGFSEIARVAGYYRQQEAAIRMRRALREPSSAAAAWQAPTLRRS